MLFYVLLKEIKKIVLMRDGESKSTDTNKQAEKKKMRYKVSIQFTAKCMNHLTETRIIRVFIS